MYFPSRSSRIKSASFSTERCLETAAKLTEKLSDISPADIRFSLSIFQPSVRKGGSKRVQRYFSTKLNLCLKMTELNTLRTLDPKQTIMNGLDRTDQFYDIDSPELQNPNQESWQMWDALKSLSSQFSNDIPQNIAKYKRHIENAIALGKLCNKRLEEPLNLQALEDMDKALSTFIKYAEL